jgi:hypothetical protein
MTSARLGRIALVAALVGLGIALWLLLPLPAATDIYAARRWSVGAGYVGGILGFPLGLVAVPVMVAIRPFPVGGDASGASIVAAIVATTVALNWAGVAALLIVLGRMVRDSRADSRTHPSRPSA